MCFSLDSAAKESASAKGFSMLDTDPLSFPFSQRPLLLLISIIFPFRRSPPQEEYQLCRYLCKGKGMRVNLVWEGSRPALEVPSDKQGSEQGVLWKGHFGEEEIHAVLHARTLPLRAWHECFSTPAAQLEIPPQRPFSQPKRQ